MSKCSGISWPVHTDILWDISSVLPTYPRLPWAGTSRPRATATPRFGCVEVPPDKGNRRNKYRTASPASLSDRFEPRGGGASVWRPPPLDGEFSNGRHDDTSTVSKGVKNGFSDPSPYKLLHDKFLSHRLPVRARAAGTRLAKVSLGNIVSSIGFFKGHFFVSVKLD